MSTAFLDTTILTDILLKPGPRATAAKNALYNFQYSALPVYAIKEFKAGPLKNFVWMHNKLVTEGSFYKALGALRRMAMTPRKHTTATALESLEQAASSIAKMTAKQLTEKYGEDATHDEMVCDEYRLAIKASVMKAWKRRRKITSEVVLPLPCYREVAPYENRGLLELDPNKCDVEECCMATELKRDPEALTKLKEVVSMQPEKRENQRRYKVLKELARKPKALMTEKHCRDLGDAYFAFFCPSDMTILTTNARDHGPLAASLGKKVSEPQNSA